MSSGEMSLDRILGVIRRRKWAFIIPAVLVLLVSFTLAVYLRPVYRSSATILIEQQDIPPEFIKTTVTTYAEQQLQIIRQRIMTSTRLLEIINKYGLYRDLKDEETTEEIIARMRQDITLYPISVDVVDPRTG
ncbi:chain-length determining protein, partial [archaeon]|nr:chain-length determining protein [archaeon]